MRCLIQRVSKASVKVDGAVAGEIGLGLLIFIGITHSDAEKDSAYLAEKCANLRIFEDDSGKMNLSLLEKQGSALVISQFTLYGNARNGRRPDFSAAAVPEKAKLLYQHFISEIRNSGILTETGVFGAEMDVEINNDGPVTIILESKSSLS